MQETGAFHNVVASRHDYSANEWQPFGHPHQDTFRQNYAQYRAGTLAVE